MVRVDICTVYILSNIFQVGNEKIIRIKVKKNTGWFISNVLEEFVLKGALGSDAILYVKTLLSSAGFFFFSILSYKVT